MIDYVSSLSKFQLIERMRFWIVTLGERARQGVSDIGISGADTDEILALAGQVRAQVQAQGMFVDWEIHDRIREKFGSHASQGIDQEDAALFIEDTLGLFRKLIGVLSFMVLKFGEKSSDGTVLFEPVPASLWLVP